MKCMVEGKLHVWSGMSFAPWDLQLTFQALFIFYTYKVHFCGILVYAISTVSTITIYINIKVKTLSSWFLWLLLQ